jgi:UDP-N-acetylglucosamine 2-epimerase (non-hydrolysing)
MVVAGTRPEVIKLAPILSWLRRLNVDYILVWSGQHYDYELSQIFFDELKISKPEIDLDVRSGEHSVQTAKLMVGVEKATKKHEPSLTMAEGDTNTVLATALTSTKSKTPFAHVEAGLRSYDRTMPEETNRVIADSCSELLFAPTELGVVNLTHEGIPRRKIHLTGNTIVDVVKQYKCMATLKGAQILQGLGVNPHEYLLLTLHRQENTEIVFNLTNIIRAVTTLSQKYRIIFPMHPRTRKKLAENALLGTLEKRRNLTIIPPQGYFEFLGLLSKSLAVLTDSGGVQEEAFTLGIPTITLRYNTERPETVLYGVNILAGTEPDLIVKLTNNQIQKSPDIKRRLGQANPFGKGDAGRRIATIIKEAVESRIEVESSNTLKDPYIVYLITKPEQVRKIQKCKRGEFEILAAYGLDGVSIGGASPNHKKQVRRLLVRCPISLMKNFKDRLEYQG